MWGVRVAQQSACAVWQHAAARTSRIALSSRSAGSIDIFGGPCAFGQVSGVGSTAVPPTGKLTAASVAKAASAAGQAAVGTPEASGDETLLLLPAAAPLGAALSTIRCTMAATPEPGLLDCLTSGTGPIGMATSLLSSKAWLEPVRSIIGGSRRDD